MGHVFVLSALTDQMRVREIHGEFFSPIWNSKGAERRAHVDPGRTKDGRRNQASLLPCTLLIMTGGEEAPPWSVERGKRSASCGCAFEKMKTQKKCSTAAVASHQVMTHVKQYACEHDATSTPEDTRLNKKPWSSTASKQMPGF